ncbi:MAG: GNAT family N-acetyltransferase [Synergistaceae bacterium]|jgi:GNAT superfamily N-acetyltransferase|nr:GNAT family N-acetyltransferase [Synergistaceae bacterium]
MLKITATNIITFNILFRPLLPDVAAYYADGCERSGDALILGAYLDEIPCGALLGYSKGTTGRISYAAVAEDYRRRGVFRDLIARALLDLRSRGVETVSISNTTSAQYGEIVDVFLKREGFIESSSKVTVLNHVNDETRTEYLDFRKTKGCVLENRLQLRGYSAKSFRDSSEGELDALKRDIGARFPENLTPFRDSLKILDDISFVVYRGGQSIAYCALGDCEYDEKTVVVKYRACASEYIRTGASLWALMKCLDGVFSMSAPAAYDKAIFYFNKNSAEMQNLMNSPITKFKGRVISESRVYMI